MLRTAVTLLVVCALAACNQKEQPAATTSTEAFPSRPPTSATSAAAPASPGREQFLSRCVLCHGETGNGDTTIGTTYPAANLTDGIWKHGSTRDAIVKTIHDGVPETPMVGFGEQMTPQEIADVADYVMSLHK
jgi:cytochrome c oxidase cbb3-type subunit 3